MSKQAVNRDLTTQQKLGIVVFVALCGFPALEMNGFGFRIPITPPYAFASAAIGGALGGALVCRRPLLAGLIGGLIAGPLGMAAVYYYTQGRQKVWNVELMLVQGLASLPGVVIGWLLKWALSSRSPDGTGEEVA
jgi:ABC-type phosphate transport system permease subunit